MSSSPQTVDALRQTIETSELRPEAKAQLLAILAKPQFSEADVEEVSLLIQQDILQDFDDQGLGDAYLKSEAHADAEEVDRQIFAELQNQLSETFESFRQKAIAEVNSGDQGMHQARIDEVKKNLDAS